MADYTEEVQEFRDQWEVCSFIEELCRHPENSKLKLEIHVQKEGSTRWAAFYANPKHRGIGILGLVKLVVKYGSLADAIEQSYPSYRFGNTAKWKVIILRKVHAA